MINCAALPACLPALVLAPLFCSLIVRIKALFAGRRGAPLLQPYFELLKLLRKDAVYSRTTTWLFRAGPVVSVAVALFALLLMPVAGEAATLHFTGDLLLLMYLLALARLFSVLAALDTGSAFEGMGASREAIFSALAEPALVLALAALARFTGELSLSEIYAHLDGALILKFGPALVLVAATLLVVILAENARIPFDDPTTHLELTMVHEVLILDHSGPDLAFIQYGAQLKLWLLSALLVNLALPVHTGLPVIDALCFLAGMGLFACAIGVLESCMARLRLVRIPQLLVGAGALSAIALVLALAKG